MRTDLSATLAVLAVCTWLQAQDRSTARVSIHGETWKNIGGYDPERDGPPPGLLPVRLKDGPGFYVDDGRILVVHGKNLGDTQPLNLPIKAASSVALSADGKTLLVGSLTDWSVWAFALGRDGMPIGGRRAFDLRLPARAERLAVTALTTDTAGRLYAATAQGIQVFDVKGKIVEVLPVPAQGTLNGLVWSGAKRDVLVAHGEWEGGSLFTRKLNAIGTEQ